MIRDWEIAMRRALLLAGSSGLRHRVRSVPPRVEGLRYRWRIEPLSEPVPRASFEELLEAPC